MKSRITLLCFSVLALTFSVFGENDPWDFQFDDRKWEVGFSHFPSSSQGGIEYVLSGETVTNWSELVTSQFATDLEGFYLDQWMENFTNSMSKKYTTFESSRISTDDGTLLFEWSHQGGDVWPAQHEIKRAIQINDSVYFLAYAKRTKNLEKETRQQWVEILKKAKLTPVNKDETGTNNVIDPSTLYKQAWTLFENGEKEKALPIFLKAADGGDAQAQCHLGIMYLKGDDVKKDLIESFKWFELAAKQNHSYAQFRLGYAYFYGDGVKGDWATGFAWFMISAENGSSEAMETCSTLKPKLKDETVQKSLSIRKKIWTEIQQKQ